MSDRTPFDYSLTLGVRKISRFAYENRNVFYDGTEKTYGDDATLGKRPGLGLAEVDYRRKAWYELTSTTCTLCRRPLVS